MEIHGDFLKKRKKRLTNNIWQHGVHILHVFRKVREQLKQFRNMKKTFPPRGTSSWESLTILHMRRKRQTNNQQDHPGLTFCFGMWSVAFVSRHCRVICGEWRLSEFPMIESHNTTGGADDKRSLSEDFSFFFYPEKKREGSQSRIINQQRRKLSFF